MFIQHLSNVMPKLSPPKSAENFAEKMKKFQVQMSKIHSSHKKKNDQESQHSGTGHFLLLIIDNSLWDCGRKIKVL